ncbi:MAG TPA: CerR family C-terminal domain-containing protein [Gemmatimonadales bacterium]|jgi:TetR/AcrR family transcriptional regulator
MPRRAAPHPPSLILDAAEQLFAERGFRAATIQELGKASGLSPALIYYYYRDKGGLYEAVIGRIIETMVGTALSRAPADADPAVALRAIVEVQGQIFLERPHVARLIARELVDYEGQHAQKAVRETLTRLFQRLSGLIASAQKTGRFRADLDPAFAAVSVVSQVAWFAVASPVVGTLLGDGAKGPSARKRQAFVRHAADFALSALYQDRGEPS